MAPEALESLTPEERHQVYKMLRIRAIAHVDGTLEVSGMLGVLDFSEPDAVYPCAFCIADAPGGR